MLEFIDIARGSTSELDTLLTLAYQVGLVDQSKTNAALKLVNEIGRMLTALRIRLSDDSQGFGEPEQPDYGC